MKKIKKFKSEVYFFNRCFEKSRLKNLISWYLIQYGEFETITLLEELKILGFHNATMAGISLSIDDLLIPATKSILLRTAEEKIQEKNQQYLGGELTSIERFQHMIDTWHLTSENLKNDVVQYFRSTNILNPVYMMAFSGARGNLSQVRQLVGMRGLMSDPQGQIIDFPISSNFREGLTLTEYVISCYGARKGIVDTALRTANSGYLTRRLVDVAQHILISSMNCGTNEGIQMATLKEGRKTLLSLKDRLLGRALAEDINKIAKKNTIIDRNLATILENKCETVMVRSPLTCRSRESICQLCYGWSLANNQIVSIGEAVGIIAAQSIGEPGTQLTMRTFHTGGVFSGDSLESIRTPVSGQLYYSEKYPGELVRTTHGKIAFLMRTSGKCYVIPDKILKSNQLNWSSTDFLLNNFSNLPKELKNQLTLIAIPEFSLLFKKNGGFVKENEIVAEFASIPKQNNQRVQSKENVIAPLEGQIFFEDVLLGFQTALTCDSIKSARQLGSLWILRGVIKEAKIKGSLFPKMGDLIYPNAPLLEQYLVSPSMGEIGKNSLLGENKDIFYKNESINKLITRKKYGILSAQIYFNFQTLRWKNKNYQNSYIPNTLFSCFLWKKYVGVNHFSLIKNEFPMGICFPESLNQLSMIEESKPLFYLKIMDSISCYTNFLFFQLISSYQKLDLKFDTIFQQNLLLTSDLLENLLLEEEDVVNRKIHFFSNKLKKSQIHFDLFESMAISVNPNINSNFTQNRQGKSSFSYSFFFQRITKYRFKVKNPPFLKLLSTESNLFFNEFKNLPLDNNRENEIESQYFSCFEKSNQGWPYQSKLITMDWLNTNPFDFNKNYIYKGSGFIDNVIFDSVNILITIGCNFVKEEKINRQYEIHWKKYSRSKQNSLWSQNNLLSKIFLLFQPIQSFSFKEHSFHLKSSFFEKSLMKKNFLTYLKKKNQFLDSSPQNLIYLTGFSSFFNEFIENIPNTIENIIDSQNLSIRFSHFYFFKSLISLNFLDFIIPININTKAYFQSTKILFQNNCYQQKYGKHWTEEGGYELRFGIFEFLSFSGFIIDPKLTNQTISGRKKFQTNPILYPKNKKNFNQIRLIAKPGETISKNEIIAKRQKINDNFSEVMLADHKFPSSLFKESTNNVKKEQILIVSNDDFICYDVEKLKNGSQVVSLLSSFLRLQEKMERSCTIPISGHVTNIRWKKKKVLIIVRMGQPILFSSRAVFHIFHNDFVRKNDLLLTLFYRRLQTGDIIQGIPKIEELFEARSSKFGEPLENSAPVRLNILYKNLVRRLPLAIAVRQSVQIIQKYLVDSVQKVYQSQGVTIADKHLEIIVRQMTSKVKILEGGQTGFLPGELVNLETIELINQGMDGSKATYEPILLGITKSSLETKSFISAASFQETTRILARAAVDKKTDFLKGLKENVILGHLIPAGTGFLKEI